MRAVVRSNKFGDAFESFIVPFYLHPPEGFTEGRVYTNIPSSLFGIEKGRPGDIDLLFVPMEGETAQVHNAVFAEVKIIRPTRSNPSKDHKDSGREQVMGLVKHGMPVVSLNHIILPDTNRTGAEQWFDLQDGKDLGLVFSRLSGVVNERQISRLERLDIPEFVGYSATLIEVLGNITMTSGNHSRFCRRNPAYQPHVGALVQQFVAQTSMPYFKLPGRRASAHALVAPYVPD